MVTTKCNCPASTPAQVPDKLLSIVAFCAEVPLAKNAKARTAATNIKNTRPTLEMWRVDLGASFVRGLHEILWPSANCISSSKQHLMMSEQRKSVAYRFSIEKRPIVPLAPTAHASCRFKAASAFRLNEVFGFQCTPPSVLISSPLGPTVAIV